MECLGAIQKFASSALRSAAETQFAADPDGAALAERWQAATTNVSPQAVLAAVAQAQAIAQRDPLFRLERFCQGYVAWGIYELGIPAIEERRAVFEAAPRSSGSATDGPAIDADLAVPGYYNSVEWHLRPGGWEGYDLYGPLGAHVIPLIFRHGGFAAVPVGGNTGRHRADAISQLPKPAYARIYEPGCGGITTLKVVHSLFPDAELAGCDLSPLLLREGHRAAAAAGLEVTLRHADAATDTGEPAESCDAVVAFALQHELPLDANRSLFAEMFRILRPGGDILLADPPPFRAVGPFHAAILAWDTDNRAEPFFSAACAADWGLELQAAGFEGVAAYAVGPANYPWVTKARKPSLPPG